jgi:hypothetical protein
MHLNSEVQHLTRSQIDTEAWDNCISKSPNGLIYGRAYFLDALADHWDALVLGDYEVVMPLPWRKKWGIRYVYQVPFLQRLGLYGQQVDAVTKDQFYQKASSIFKFINYKTDSLANNDVKAFVDCTNFIIPLHSPYSLLQGKFSAECKKNIRKSESRGCVITDKSSAKQVINFFKKAYGHFYSYYSEDVYSKLEKLIELGQANNFCQTYAVLDSEQQVVFTAALFFDEKRIYYSVGAPNEKGRQMRAPYFFINEVLKQYAEQNLVFDFEGSDIPTVASFYSKFGPVTEQYFDILINKLPAPLRWIKSK